MPRPRHRSPFQTLASPPGASQAPQGVGQHSRPHPLCGPLRPTEVAVDGSAAQNGGVDCPKHREEKGQLSVSLNSRFCCRQSLCSLQPPPPGEGRGCSLVPCRGQGAVLLCHLGLDWSQMCTPPHALLGGWHFRDSPRTWWADGEGIVGQYWQTLMPSADLSPLRT